MDQENIPILRPRMTAKNRSLPRTDTFSADETLQLPSPPSSQLNLLDMDFHSMRASSEASRSLISPPPEEFLQNQRSPAQKPFAPSILANAHGLFSDSKRKRNAMSNTSSTSTIDASREQPNVAPTNLEATPNPKPRKQPRRHSRTPSMESDTDMGSPSSTVRRRLKPLRVASPVYEEGEQQPEHTPSPQTTPTRAQRTSPIRRNTPRKSRTISPKTSPSKPRRNYLQSPHTSNPEADYVPPIPIQPLEYEAANHSSKVIRRARRSVTPVVPPYEPPPDIFTPPKLVVLSPQPQSRPRPISKPRMSRTRSGTPKAEPGKSRKRVTGVLTIKTEMPEIDLTGPAPPPSPTDDPLLLSGPIEVPSSSGSRSRVRRRGDDREEQLRTPIKPKPGKHVKILLPEIPPYHSRASSSISPSNAAAVTNQVEEHFSPPRRSAIPSDLPASSPFPSSDDDDDAPGDGLPEIPFDLPDNETSTDMDIDGGILPVFAFDANAADAPFSDSDDDDDNLPLEVPPLQKKDALVIGEGEGEFTGRWKLLTVPTKNDPPSSATRERMDRWGRPISPFPKKSLDLGEQGLPVNGAGNRDESPVVVGAPEREEEELFRVTDRRDEPGRPDGGNTSKVLEEAGEYHPAPAGAFDFDVSFEQDSPGPDDSQDTRVEAGEYRYHQQDDTIDVSQEPSFEYESVPNGAFDFDVSFEEELKGGEDEDGDTNRDEIFEAGGAKEVEEAIEVPGTHTSNEQDDALQYESEEANEPIQRPISPPATQDPSFDIPIAQSTDNAYRQPDNDMSEGEQEEEQPHSAMDTDPSQLPLYSTHDVPSTTSASDLPPSSDPSPETEYLKPEDDDAHMESLLSERHEEDDGEEGEVAKRPEAPAIHFQELMVEDAMDESEDDDDEAGDASLVEITSADPRAAARAAAILKQHDYELYTKIILQQRQKKGNGHRSASLASVEDVARSSRRRSVSSAGVSKSRSPRPRSLSSGLSPVSSRRRTLGGMVGDKVVIPGSPAMTIPELLQEAEEGLRADSGHGSVSNEMGSLKKAGSPLARDPYATPCPANRRFPMHHLPVPETVDHRNRSDFDRAWTKDDWKRLDSCFTDERLELGATVALGEDIEGSAEVLADVDDVSLDDVVNRFVELIGGEEVLSTYGDAWRRDNLLRRAKALQDKQRNGYIPPPTIPAHVRTPSPFAFGKLRSASLEVPDFTPAAVRYAPRLEKQFDDAPLGNAPVRTTSVPFSTVEPLFQNLPPEKPSRKLPPTLYAPRYSHLLEEAVAVSQLGFDTPQDVTYELDADDDSQEPDTNSMLVDQPATPQPPMTMGKRVKGIIFSYLPSLSKTAPQPSNRQKKGASGLPLPPPDLLEKHRKPIVTPARPPLPRPAHPKELVNLNPAPPVPQKVSLPKKENPKRLVELIPVTPPVEKSNAIPVPRPRRSSGGSVKDLVKSFECMEKEAGKVGGVPPILKRVKSITEMKKGKEGHRPAWRP